MFKDVGVKKPSKAAMKRFEEDNWKRQYVVEVLLPLENLKKKNPNIEYPDVLSFKDWVKKKKHYQKLDIESLRFVESRIKDCLEHQHPFMSSSALWNEVHYDFRDTKIEPFNLWERFCKLLDVMVEEGKLAVKGGQYKLPTIPNKRPIGKESLMRLEDEKWRARYQKEIVEPREDFNKRNPALSWVIVPQPYKQWKMQTKKYEALSLEGFGITEELVLRHLKIPSGTRRMTFENLWNDTYHNAKKASQGLLKFRKLLEKMVAENKIKEERGYYVIPE